MSIKLRKIVWFSLGAAILIYILTLSYQYFDSKSAYSLPLAGQMIVLDPGHGGRDGGAASQSGVLEKDVTLTIAFYRSEEHTSELQSRFDLVCRLLLEKK